MLQQGDRARMKILPIDPEADLPLELLAEVLQMAITIREKK